MNHYTDQIRWLTLVRADWNISDEMNFCSLTDIKVKEQSVENMMRWAPNTSGWLCIHIHTQALLSHDQRHAHSHSPDSVNLPVHDLHYSEGRRSTSLLDSWLSLRLQISWFKSSRGGGKRGQTQVSDSSADWLNISHTKAHNGLKIIYCRQSRHEMN